jgi:hypothetical protein
LIRYASEDEIEKKEPFKTARMKGYTAIILAILVGIIVYYFCVMTLKQTS